MPFDYPVSLDVERPSQFDRLQIVLRFVILIVLGWIGMPLGWIFGLLYLGLPALAAGLLSTRDGARYLGDAGPRIVSALEWLLAWFAYLGLVIDRPPADRRNTGVHLTGTPAAADQTISRD
ncbi:MAG: hypothetical protein V2A73_17045 [Pseudomonadota bacterium]